MYAFEISKRNPSIEWWQTPNAISPNIDATIFTERKRTHFRPNNGENVGGSAGRQFRKLLASGDKPSRVPIASAFCIVIKQPFLKGETRRIVYAKFQSLNPLFFFFFSFFPSIIYKIKCSFGREYQQLKPE